MNSFAPKILTAEEVKSFQNDFDLATRDLDLKEKIWKEMSDFFEKSTPGQDESLKNTFFRWYTELNWEFFSSLNQTEVLRALDRQVPMAILSGINVVKEAIFYLNLTTSYYNPIERSGLYSKMRSTFLLSPSIIGVWKENNYILKELADEKKLLRVQGASSLEVAEFDAKIKKILFPNGLQNIFGFFDPNEVLENLLETVDFFLDISPEDINNLIESYTHPDISVIEPGETETVSQPLTPQPSPYLALKSALEAEFPRDVTGHFLNMAEVLGRLEAIAKDSGDERVKELYYFNEATGKFEWNEAMINPKS